MDLIFYLLSCQAKIFFRDKVAVLLTIFLPLIMGVTTSYSLLPSAPEARSASANTQKTADDNDRKPTQLFVIEFVALADVPNTEAFVTQLKSNADFSSRAAVSISRNLEQSLKNFESGKINMLLVVSEQNGSGIVQFKYASVNPAMGGVAELLARELVSQFNLVVAGANAKYRFEQYPMSHIAATESASSQKDVADHQSYNKSQIAFYLPNFLALSILWLGLFSSALPLASDRAEGVFVQLAIANLRMETLIFTYVLWRILIGIVLSLLFVASGMLLLGVEGIHNIPAFFTSIILGNLFMTVFGVLLVSVSQSVQTANVLTQISNLLLMFTSGLMLPLDNVPDVVRYFSYANPMTYIGDLLRQSMMNYQPMNDVAYNLGTLSLILVLMLIVIKFKWKWR